MQLIEITDEAIVKLLEQQEKENFKYIRLGITGGGCAGFEYIFDSVNIANDDDIIIDFGKLKFVVNKFINPKEKDSCGCGVSINFDLEQVELDKSKIFAIEV